MSDHNVIGKKHSSKSCGQPFAHWEVFDASGTAVGLIEADYDQSRKDWSRWVVTQYRVWWFDDHDREGAFTVYAHGTAAKALAAAQGYAKATTTEIRKTFHF
jgi:hypothetical protein